MEWETQKNQWKLLTPPGEGALQVIECCHFDEELTEKLNSHFEAHHSGNHMLKVGSLYDESGKLIDEIIFERFQKSFRLHLHGGAMSLQRTRQLLEKWGCEVHEQKSAQGLQEELVNALCQAPTKEAVEVALNSFKDLPSVDEPSFNLLESWEYGRSLFEPRKYLLIGLPNAGKSSLLNRMAGHTRAVVTDIAGTTRDLIEVTIEVAGRQIILIDGAGLRFSEDPLEVEGQELVHQMTSQSHLLWVVNPHDTFPACPVDNPKALILTHEDHSSECSPVFSGPIIRTGNGDCGESLREFIEADLPHRCEGPVIFTHRQKALVQEFMDTASWDSEKWMGSSLFPRF